ncbi:MAG: GNAT family N-acetyltransferase [Clostridium sp.]|nr:GNAT family N-acetyltransferase [Clostridium sp.]
MEFEVTDKIEKADEEVIYNGLLEYNLKRLEDKEPKELGIYIRNDKNEIIAGLIGSTHGNWLLVKYLWLEEELRGSGIGSKILKKAEETARDRGAKYVFLDTFSFQAPMFYEKQGYKKVFVLDNYPITGKRYYYTKELL